MNHDLGLSLTPANARRLLRIQHVSNVELPDELHELAKQDTIGDIFDPFVCPFTAEKQAIAQFLMDCDLRGIVQRMYHSQFDEVAVLNTIRISKPEHVIVFTERREVWRLAASQLFLKIRTHDPFRLTSEEIDQYRSGVLVVDWDHDSNNLSKIRSFGTEFSRIILFDNQPWTGLRYPWPFLAHALFPTMPHPIYPKIVENIPDWWRDKPIHLFSVYYNMCIFKEFIKNLSVLEDKALHSSIQQYKRVFQLG